MILKCKMCGGDLEITEDIKLAECEYCGTKQTVPNADSEKKLNLFNRANRLRMASEFDKAAGIYENIIAEFPEEAEAYWGLCLCNYGIEYVDDPATAKKIPTCHRASFESLQKDENFGLALEYADVVAQKLYRDEAREIDRIMSEILAVSKNEKPYDVFICYKETDDKGARTVDSVLAYDIYEALTTKGLKVFFSRVTLEDKLGRQYEPYIFAALNSAKVMLSIGTKYEYFHAVWVKNEWSRFLKLMAKDKSKVLIPCYKDIDAYDMPDEFKGLQAQDLGKLGAVQDIVRGVEKIVGVSANKNEVPTEKIVEKVVVNQTAGGPNVEALLKRGNMSLEDGNFEQAKDFFNQVLNMNAECAEAYLGIAMAEEETETKRNLVFKNNLDNRNYQRAKQFADSNLLKELNTLEAEAAEDRKRKKKAAEEERIRKERELKKKIEKYASARNMIATGSDFTVGLKSDGTVVAVGKNDDGRCDVEGWTDIVAVSALSYHTVGLKSDGTVVSTGHAEKYGYCGQYDVFDWKDIVAVSAGVVHTVGLKSDGTVVAVGSNDCHQCDVSAWKDIVAVSVGGSHTIGLKSDGTVVATGKNYFGQCDVDEWTDIVAISAGDSHTVGLKSDGTVVAVGENDDGRCDVSVWNDIIAVSAGKWHSVGLKSDGTVVATAYTGKYTDYGQSNVSAWKDIVAVSAGQNHTVGLKLDGTVVAVGFKGYDRCNVSDWKLFDSFENLEEERKNKLEEKRLKAEEDRIRKEKEFQEARIRLAPIREKLSIAKKALIQTPNSKYSMHFGLSLEGRVYISCEDKYKSKAANWTDVIELSAGEFHVIGLKSDGTVCATGDNKYDQCNVGYWNDIVQIASGGWHSVGLMSNGTVVASGCSDDERINVSSWTDIVKVSAGRCHTVGLKRNGTVVATGLNNGGRCNVSSWRDIVDIWAFNGVTVGLKKNGTVVVVGDSIENCDVSDWTDIVDVSIGYEYMMGLKNNGTVLLTGKTFGGMDVSGWRDIVSISAKNIHAVGLRADGTVVATGVNEAGQCDVNDWRDIVAISAGNFCTLGLKENGTVVNAGVENAQPYDYISRWKLFNNYNNILIEQKHAQKAMNFRSQNLCQYCGGTFKGMFTKKCTSCGKEKDY